MQKFYNSFLALFILINLVFIQSCKKNENPIIPPDETVKIPSTTKYITPTDYNSYFVGFSNDSTQLIFKSEANTKYDYKVNDVIVISEGEGLLKKITNIQTSNSQLILSTEDAALTEAIEKGVVNFTQPLSPSIMGNYSNEFGIEVKNNKSQKTGQTTSFTITINQILYDHDNNFNTNYDQVKLTGSLELGPNISGTIELENFDVKKIDISYEMIVHLTLQATVGILPSIPVARKNFPKIPLGQIVVIVGGVPVIINPELNITAGVEIYNNSKVKFGIEQSLSYTSGMKYENGNWTTYKQIDSSFTYQIPEFEIDFGAKAYIKPQLDLKIYKTLAPYLYADLYSKFAVTPLQTPVWKLFGGLDIGGGVKMKIFKKNLFDFSAKFFTSEFILAQGGSPGVAPQPPTLSSPSNGATNISTTPTLSWNASTGATGYTLQVSPSNNFTSYIYNSDVGNIMSKQITSLNNSTTYYWRVKASNVNGTSDPSTAWNFTTSSGSGGIPTQGLVAYYPFNGNANDESGNSNHGTVFNATLTTDRFNNSLSAYYFDGNNDYIEIADAPDLRLSKITITAWVFIESATSSYECVLGKSDFTTAAGEQYYLFARSQDFQMGIKRNSNCLNSVGWYGSNIPSNNLTGQWKFLSASWDGNTYKLHLDGDLKYESSNFPQGDIDYCEGGELRIGKWWNGQKLFFKGKIDDIRIFNRALSINEINQLYHESGW